MKRVSSPIFAGVDLELLGEVLADQGEDFVALHRRASYHASLARLGERAAAGAALAQQRRGAPDRVDLDAAGRQPDRVGDALGAGAAVADDGDRRAGRAGSRRRSCRGAARGAGRRAPGCSSRPPSAAIGLERAASRIAPVTVFAVPSISFSATLPVKPSVTTTSAAPAGRSRPSTLPAKSIPRRREQDRVGLDDLLAALAGLLADREQADPRALDPEHRLAEGGAEEGELDQVLGADLDVGADVEEEHRLAGDRQLHGERRPLHALEPPQPEGRRRHRRPGRAGADHRRRRRPRRRRAAARTTEASCLARTAGTGSSSLPIHSAVGTTSIPSTPSSPSSRRRPEDAHADPVGGGQPRALGEHVEALLGPEAVEGDGHAAPRRHGYSESVAVAGGSATVCEMTSRPA